MSTTAIGPTTAASLASVLAVTEDLGASVRECAAMLSSLNLVLRREAAKSEHPPAMNGALDESDGVQKRMHDASEALSEVNLALKRQLRGRVMLDHQLAAAVEQEEGGRHAAFHDGLTGLPNRALFHDRLQHGLALARRHGWALTVMFVDLNDFKSINDTHGHAAGDAVLQAVARRLEDNARGEDTVSRFGGDEFLYMLTELRDEVHIAGIARKIIDAIREPCDIDLGDDQHVSLVVETSIGIAIFPRDGITGEDLIKSADAAMYTAKLAKSGHAFAVQPDPAVVRAVRPLRPRR